MMQKIGFSSDSSTAIVIEVAKPKPKPTESNLTSFILSELHLISSIKFDFKLHLVSYLR